MTCFFYSFRAACRVITASVDDPKSARKSRNSVLQGKWLISYYPYPFSGHTIPPASEASTSCLWELPLCSLFWGFKLFWGNTFFLTPTAEPKQQCFVKEWDDGKQLIQWGKELHGWGQPWWGVWLHTQRTALPYGTERHRGIRQNRGILWGYSRTLQSAKNFTYRW